MMSDLRTVIASVKASNRLEDIVQRYGVALKTASRRSRYEGLCPFHTERTPSFSIYLQSQRFFCYGCGATGDVIDFVQQIDQCSLVEALHRLGGDVENIREPVPSPRADVVVARRTRERATVREHEERRQIADHTPVLTLAQDVYHQAIFRFPFVLDYLLSRGISYAGVSLCRLGYADGSSFRMHLQGESEWWRKARDAGLLTRTGKEWLSGRLIIPELVGGRCVWMIGRALPRTPHWTFRAQDKYLGLPLPKPVLGHGAAEEELRVGSRVQWLQGILVQEGALDYVVAREWELPVLSTAILGTHACLDQLRALLHLQDLSGGLPFLNWPDNDEQGSNASLHFFDQVRGRPIVTFPAIAAVKDLTELAERGEDGYTRFLHAWHSVGEGGELW